MDNIQKIKATTEWMAEHYAKANQELFDGKLMECSFQIKTIGSRTLGQFHVDGGYKRLLVDRYSRRMFIKNSFSGDKQLINKENFVELCHPVIFMNSNYSGTEVSLYTTLVHEMCHYYTYMYGYCPRQGHGSEFRDIASLVSYRSHGLFTIQRLASAEEMSGYELDDKVKQQIERRKENKINRLSYLIIVTKNGDMRLVNTANMGLINKIIDLHDKRGEKVFKLLNHDIAQELYKLGFNSEMRTYKYWTLNKDSVIVKQIFANPDNYKNLTDDYLTENIMNKKLKHNTVEITPDMDLGQYSPLEILNETKTIKITESQLRKIIRESLKKITL